MSESIPHGWSAQQPGEFPAPAASYDQQWGGQPPRQPVPGAQPEPGQEELPSEFDYLFRGSVAGEPTSVMTPRGVTMQPPPGQPAAEYQAEYPAPYQPEAYTQGAYPPAQQGYQQQPYSYPQADAGTGLVPGFGGSGGDFPDRRGWHPEPGGPDGGSRRTIAIIAGVAVVAVIVGVSVAVFSSGGGSSSPVAKSTTTTGVTTTTVAASNETAKQEADAIYALIQTASSLRKQVGSAVDSAKRCVNETQDASTLTSVSQQRQQLATEVAKLPVDKLSQGTQLTAVLAKAWTDSATDDAAYAAWAQSNANCHGTAAQNGSYQQASNMTSQISNEKSQAVSIWNQVAVPAGEASISTSQL
jgi:hypothetical protein